MIDEGRRDRMLMQKRGNLQQSEFPLVFKCPLKLSHLSKRMKTVNFKGILCSSTVKVSNVQNIFKVWEEKEKHEV